MNTEQENAGPGPGETLGTDPNVQAPAAENTQSEQQDSAENASDTSTSAEGPSYEEALADRIIESNYPVTVIAHKDFVRLNAAGLIDFETKKLKNLKGGPTGQQLEISENPDCPTNSFWDASTFIK